MGIGSWLLIFQVFIKAKILLFGYFVIFMINQVLFSVLLVQHIYLELYITGNMYSLPYSGLIDL